jgi:cytosine/adenosine deaminase-related metal-dependent hydrolase
MHSQVQALRSYNLLRAPFSRSDTSAKVPFLLLSHGNGLSQEDLELLAETGTPVSSTPGTESQMGMGYPIALHPALKAKPTTNVSLGIDCHSNNSASIPLQGRMLLLLTRAEKNAKIVAEGDFPSDDVTGTSEEIFNLATIRGAQCLGLEEKIGSIKVGKKADLVVFDAAGSVGMLSAAEHDPVVAIMRFSEAADIEHVIVDGVMRKRDGKVVATEVSLDGKGATEWKGVAEEVRRSQREIQKRVDGLSLEKGRETLLGMMHVDVSKLVSAE